MRLIHTFGVQVCDIISKSQTEKRCHRHAHQSYMNQNGYDTDLAKK